MTTLIHHCEGGKEGTEPRWEWCGWSEWAAPVVTSHYATKQFLSSSIFQSQQQNADDRSSGYRSLEVHMANMIIFDTTATDTIKVTLNDGGWQRLSRSFNPGSSHCFHPNHLKEVCSGNYLPTCKMCNNLFLLLCCSKFSSRVGCLGTGSLTRCEKLFNLIETFLAIEAD